MALFREKVALEACPAKTAESISYAATFGVLGWLLLSNASALDSPRTSPTLNLAASPGTSDATQSADEGLLENTASRQLAFERTSESPTYSPPNDYSHPSIEFLHPALTTIDLVAWHESLNTDDDTAYPHASRYLKSERWLENDESLTLPINQEELEDLAFRTIEFEKYAVQAEVLAEGSVVDSVTGDSASQIEAITVTGSDSQRLNARVDNIKRPQLPRPYRANRAQLTPLLPPRIQALRP